MYVITNPGDLHEYVCMYVGTGNTAYDDLKERH